MTEHDRAARHDPIYDRLHATPEFAELRHRYRSFVIPASPAAVALAARPVGDPAAIAATMAPWNTAIRRRVTGSNSMAACCPTCNSVGGLAGERSEGII